MEIEEMLDTVSIVDYISQFVELSEHNGEYWGLSPFKDEKTPSFSVREETGRFFDFSSGIGGNVITFIKFFNQCSCSEAVDILKKYIGDKEHLVVSKHLNATKVCKRFFNKGISNKQISSNKLSNDCMDRFDFDVEKLNIWMSEGISQNTLLDFGVKYDKYSERIVYPIKDVDGNIVNIGARTTISNWKEMNLRKYTYLSKWNGSIPVIYGLYENIDSIKRENKLIVFEGCKSVLIANNWGIKNTGALLTSHLSPIQMKILAKLGLEVIFALDKEIDIKKDHNINILKRYVKVSYYVDGDNLLEEKDSPVDKGKDTFIKLIEEREVFE